MKKQRGQLNLDSLLVLAAIFFVCAVVVLGYGFINAASAAQQAIYGGEAREAPWYIVIAIVLAPGAAAVFLTITTIFYIRRLRRDVVKKKAYDALTLIKFTLLAGALWGPLMQWGLQRVASDLTGLQVYWELVVIAFFITGPASMGIYEFILMPYLKKKHPGVYETLKVRHRKDRGHVGETPPGDLTVVANREDTTGPRE